MRIRRMIVWITAVCLFLSFYGCTEEPQPEPPTTVPVTEPTTEPETLPPTEPPTEPPQELVMAQPVESGLTTWEETLVFEGTADPRYPLEINGVTVQTDENGRFTYEATLEPGENSFTVTYLEETRTYTAQRNYTTAWFAHAAGADVGGGATVFAELYAREGSTVVVSFNGETKTVEPSVNQLGMGAPEGFDYYVARFLAPNWNKEPVEMGPITYTVTCDEITEVYTSGNMVCNAYVTINSSDPEATPDAEGYRNVGSGYIAEVVDVSAETFDGWSIDDKSRPTNNYLPKGTVDYCSQGTYYNSDADRHYYLLRCGVRVYSRGDNRPAGMAPVVDCYNGYLPDHNELNVASFEIRDHFTVLTLDCLWKAPFYFDEEEQIYDWLPYEQYVLEAYTATYVDIRFCYATVFTGEVVVPEDHPLFSKAELTMNGEDCTLRLYLKEKGKFYGWNAYYNEQDQLCFQFLNPVTVSQADNAYGADLTGLKIAIDVGHGGWEAGAVYADRNGRYWSESVLNLALANMVREGLESIGAVVVMNRTEDVSITRMERFAFLMQEEPDFCICIHHNARGDQTASGYESWYFTPFSMKAAKHVADATEATGIYDRTGLAWHYYYVCRQTSCPTVLGENGYMTNYNDMDRITDETYMRKKAQAIVQGIVNYYLEESGFPTK